MDRVIVVSNAGLGTGDEELGHKLMGLFLTKLRMQDSLPDAVIFYNEAVRLLSKGSPFRGSMEGLIEAGVDLMACGTCLKHFGMDEDEIVGRVTGMSEVVGNLLKASSVITV